MNCYAIVNNGNQSLKRLGDKILISLLKQKIFAKYIVFGRIIVLESEQELSDVILNSKHLCPCIFTSSKEHDIYESIILLVENAIPTKNFAVRVDTKGIFNAVVVILATSSVNGFTAGSIISE